MTDEIDPRTPRAFMDWLHDQLNREMCAHCWVQTGVIELPDDLFKRVLAEFFPRTPQDAHTLSYCDVVLVPLGRLMKYPPSTTRLCRSCYQAENAERKKPLPVVKRLPSFMDFDYGCAQCGRGLPSDAGVTTWTSDVSGAWRGTVTP